MAGKTRSLLLSLTIVVVIIFSAFGPTIAYADGGTTSDPPPTQEATSEPGEASIEKTSEVTEVTSEVASENTATGESPEVAAEATATPEAVAVEPTGDESESTEEAAPVAEEAAPAPEEPVLSEVPENTEVAVIDKNGETQPLATQEAAEAIAQSDPIWCPSGASPAPGTNGCTDSFSSFSELLTFLSGNAAYQGPGTIYVEQGAYQGSDSGSVIDFNAYDLSNIRNSSLTVIGGWSPGSGTVDPAGTSNFTDTHILIGSSDSLWGGSLSVNNITMTFRDEQDTSSEPALGLYATGDVSLANVTISAAPSDGADIQAGGSVTIEDSKFHRNQLKGANIRAGANVNISNSEFQNPLVTRQRRQDVGVDINSGGEVTLANVIANGNRHAGATIVAGSQVTIGTSFFNGMKDIVGPRSNPTEYLGYGLRVETPAQINVESVTANDNFLWGAYLIGGGEIAVRNSVFNDNTTETDGFIDDTGLFIEGDDIVSLSNVTASNNRMFGTQITADGTVSITGSTFNNNRGVANNTLYGHGMQIRSLADIIIQGSQASGNLLFGGELNADGQVNVANSTFNNNSSGDSANAVGRGLGIVSGGNTTLGNVVLDSNQTDGATIQASGSVTLVNVTATNNGDDGVEVNASCVHLQSGTFSGNGGYGVNLGGNTALNLMAPPAFSNNGSGDIFPDSPPTCSLVVTPLPLTAMAATNVFASLQLAPQTSAGDNRANVSLNEFMGHTRTFVGGIEVGIFHGNYVYAYSSAGMQILALAPSYDTLAME